MPKATGDGPDSGECAHEFLDVIPLAARWVRAAVRRREPGWSLAQLQALGFLHLNPGASLNDLAGHLGVGPSAASTMVSRLVSVDQVDRQEDPAERRRVLLRLTPQGEGQFATALGDAGAEVARRFETLSARDRATLRRSFAILRRLFADA
ncbi:MAG TPA: MarR family winged helix-turn-helix transcriptional regulator [Acidimicrobiia bacterium]|nr:MarR family winged helix-turn-helix transcriptional regulator [Acidimicrobiia bacterium]